jgi:hypothetical protein
MTSGARRNFASIMTCLALGLGTGCQGGAGLDLGGLAPAEMPAGQGAPAVDETPPEDVEAVRAAYLATSRTSYLVLDGTLVGVVKNFTGGNVTGQVLVDTVGATGATLKHLGAVSYEDISFDIDTGTGKVFWQWVQETLARRFVRHGGSIVTLDLDLKEAERLDFFDAGIAEIGFPALDAASRASAPLKIKLRPSSTNLVAGSGATGPALPAATMPLVASNFRLVIPSLATNKVTRIDPFVVKVTVPPLRSTAAWTVTIPNLSLSVSAPFADWNAWAQDFIIKGNNSAAAEKTASLRLIAADLKTTLLTLDLTGLGIFHTAPDPASATVAVARELAAMYCEDAKLTTLPP